MVTAPALGATTQRKLPVVASRSTVELKTRIPCEGVLYRGCNLPAHMGASPCCAKARPKRGPLRKEPDSQPYVESMTATVTNGPAVLPSKTDAVSTMQRSVACVPIVRTTTNWNTV